MRLSAMVITIMFEFTNRGPSSNILSRNRNLDLRIGEGPEISKGKGQTCPAHTSRIPPIPG